MSFAQIQLLGTAQSNYSTAVLADSPYAYYRLADTSGTTAVDSSGNGRNGTYSASGITLNQQGLLSNSTNTSVLFNPAGNDASQVDCGFSTELTTACTLEALININATPAQTANYILTKSGYYAASYTDFPISLAYSTASGTVYLVVSDGTSYSGTSLNYSISRGTRYHVVGVYRSAGQCELWVNGVMRASTTISFTIPSNGRNWKIGAPHQVGGGVGDGRFTGIIDEAAIYSTALSSTRIQAHWLAS